ncbi:MAG: acyl-CoA thioesterase [Solirubrobacterales bacterium]|jgi:acyl-CoA thioester hydrolase|nr:acyl-CoA thioesterase [Solirubrobacterales bacterium]
MAAFTHVDRVRFADLDAMRHLNNVALMTFFESARIAYIASRLEDYAPDQRDEFGLIFAEGHVNYRTPAFYDQELRTTITPTDIARSSFRLGFQIHATADDRLVAEGYGVLVGFDYSRQHATVLPDDMKAALAADVAAAAEAS